MYRKIVNMKKELMVEVEHDNFDESPREWDNLGTFYTWTNRYNSPDDNNFNGVLDFISYHLGEKTTEAIYNRNNSTDDFLSEALPRMYKKGYIMYPVSKFEHGNVIYRIGTANGWDSGTVGFIFARKEKIYEEFDVKRVIGKIQGKVEKIFKGELENYTKWCNGEVNAITVTDLEGNIVDSIGGIYDDLYTTDDIYDDANIYFSYIDLGNKEDWQGEK